MPDQATPDQGNIQKSSTQEEFPIPETAEDKALDRIADSAAQRASRTEHNYDRDHDIFTK